MATYSLPVNSQFTESGDDVYFKPTDGNLTGTNWPDDSVSAIEVEDTNVYEVTLDETKSYIGYLNAHSQAFTADAGTDDQTDIVGYWPMDEPLGTVAEDNVGSADIDWVSMPANFHQSEAL